MLSLVLVSALAANDVSVALEPMEPDLGGVLAPAALGPGTVALYGLVGAPEQSVGYRQGFSILELEARVGFDVVQAAAVLEAGLKVPVLRSGRWLVAVGGLLGLKLDSGARHADPFNFGALSLQPRALATASLEVSGGVSLLARLEVPLAIALTSPGLEFRPLVSAGAEFRMGRELSLLLLGQGGLDVVHTPAGLVAARGAWGLQVGVGYRVF
jgi:hypothetical protein